MHTSLETFLSRPSSEVAPQLLGSVIEREIEGKRIRVRIVETEAYHESDAASHSYKGRTERTEILFGKAGHLYVYFTYGMHYCANIVTGKEGAGEGVLIRAVEPLEGVEYMEELRNRTGVELTNGPAKLCQALAINKQFNGHSLAVLPITLILQPPLDASKITQTVRVGISQAKDLLWRFYITNNSYVSKP